METPQTMRDDGVYHTVEMNFNHQSHVYVRSKCVYPAYRKQQMKWPKRACSLFGKQLFNKNIEGNTNEEQEKEEEDDDENSE